MRNRSRSALGVVALLVSLAALLPSWAVETAGAPAWPMYQSDAAHSGYTPFSLGKNPVFSLRWQRAVGRRALYAVTAAAGKVFVAPVPDGIDFGMAALDATTGQTVWSKGYAGHATPGPPSYADGRVYLQSVNHSGDTWLHAYDAASGEEQFRSPYDSQWQNYLAPTVAEGTAYIGGGYYGGMYAMDAVTGRQLWFTPLPQYDGWTPSLDASRAYAYLGIGTSSEPTAGLYALNRGDGSLAYWIPDPNFDWVGYTIDSAPALGEDSALVAHQGRLICFDTKQRSIRWQLPRGYTSQPAIHEGLVYAVANGGLAVLRESDGGLVWSWFPDRGNLQGGVILTPEHVIAETDTTLFVVSRTSHRQVTSYPASGKLSLGEGLLLVAQQDGTVLALGLGAPRATVKPNQVQFGTVRRGGRKVKAAALRNDGTVPLQVEAIEGLVVPFGYDGPRLPFSVAPGSTSPLRFVFAPGRRGTVGARAVVRTNDPARPKLTIRLSGTGR